MDIAGEGNGEKNYDVADVNRKRFDSGKHHQSLLDKLKCTRDVLRRPANIFGALQARIVHWEPGEVPGLIHLFVSELEEWVLEGCFTLHGQLHPPPGSTDQDVSLTRILMHSGIDRNGVINRKSLNFTERPPTQDGELEELGFEDGGITAGLRILLSVDWCRRRQEHGETDEGDDGRAQ